MQKPQKTVTFKNGAKFLIKDPTSGFVPIDYSKPKSKRPALAKGKSPNKYA